MAEAIPDAALDELVAAKLPTVISGGNIPAASTTSARSAEDSIPPPTSARPMPPSSTCFALGHRTFAYVAEAPHLAGVQARIAGFRRALADHGVPPADGRVLTETEPIFPNSEFGYQATNELLAAGDRPTAICASSDMVAMGVLRALHEHGLAVPGDVSVVGHDGITHAAYTVPPLTTLQTPYEAWCRAALALLRHLIEPSSAAGAGLRRGVHPDRSRFDRTGARNRCQSAPARTRALTQAGSREEVTPDAHGDDAPDGEASKPRWHGPVWTRHGRRSTVASTHHDERRHR